MILKSRMNIILNIIVYAIKLLKMKLKTERFAQHAKYIFKGPEPEEGIANS